MTAKYEETYQLKEYYEGIVSSIISPPMKIVDVAVFGNFK